MNRKLLFFDVDGTLLAGGIDGYVPESAIKGMRQAQANGHLCFVNSGRTRSFIPKLVRDFPFDGYVCGVGTDIQLHGETLLSVQIPEEVKRSLTQICHRCNMQIVAEGPYTIYYEDREDIYPGIKAILDSYARGVDVEKPISTFDDEVLDFCKFIIFFDDDGDVPLFKELTKDHFYYIERESYDGRNFAEIVPIGYDKGTGIDFLVDYFGLSLDDCYVFGDSNNDMSMLTHVKHSIAMGNSYPEILGKTEYVTTHIEQDGIYHALKHYELI